MPALPALSKNWCTRANIPFPSNVSAENIADSALWLLKACLMDQVSTGTLTGTRHANSVWSCVRSSDSSAFGSTEDGVDRWLSTFDATKLVHNSSGSAHSWIILRNAQLERDLLIDMNTATTANVRIAGTKSSVPFSGGSASVSPATTSEAWIHASSSDAVSTNSVFIGDATLSATHYAHFSVDDTGQFFFLINRASTGIFHSGVGMFRSVGAAAGDTRNVFLFGGAAITTGRGWPAASNVKTAAGCTARDAVGTSAASTSGVAMPQAANTTITEQNSVSDAFDSNVRFVELTCWDTASPAYRGTVEDLFAAIGGGVGTSYPTTAAQTWIAAGNFLIPFNGTVPLL